MEISAIAVQNNNTVAIKKKQARKKTFAFMGAAAGLFIFFSLALAGIAAITTIKTLPSADEISNRQVNQSTKIFDRAGEVLLYEIYGEEKRTIIPFSEIPDSVKEAVIAIEDQSFYEHPAFDWRGILRALIRDALHLERREGGSTITQQLAKNAFLSNEKTVARKIKELFLALKLEQQYSKDEILNLYLNQIPFGANAYGIEAAAKTYFNESAKDLSIAESALLAALPQAPTYYSPWGTHLDELLIRKNFILDQLERLGYIDAEQKKTAKAAKLKFAPQSTSIKAPHFVMAVQDYLIKKYGDDALRAEGFKITTTLDMKLQVAAEKAVAEGAKRNAELYKGRNAALFAEDPRTGQILAVVGSKDYFDIENEGNFNVAMQGLRQPGSAFKPFAYVTAFKAGYTPETVLFDVATEFDTTKIPSRSYKPGNFDELFRGPVSLRNALAQSVNIPATKIMYLAGIDNVLKTASDFGITTLTERSRYGLSLVLGGGEVKLSELVGAYSVFGAEGQKHDQTLILKIENSAGQVIEQYEEKGAQVIEPQYARLINDILSDSKARAPLYGASLGLTIFPNRDVALKTGTTNNYVDAWAMGYTPSLAVGVWAGNNHREPLQKRGGSILAAVPIWSQFLNEALKDAPEEFFTKPDPMPAPKPILRGEYVAKKQLHSILYYVDKRDPQGPYPANSESDPQFDNWEAPVLAWGRANIPNFSEFNQGAAVFDGDAQPKIEIKITSPNPGEFISTKFPLRFAVSSEEELQYVEIYLNTFLVEKTLIGGTSYIYDKTVETSALETQNLITVKTLTKSGAEKQESIIVYK